MILSNILFYETALITKESTVNAMPLDSTGGGVHPLTQPCSHMRGLLPYQIVPPPLGRGEMDGKEEGREGRGGIGIELYPQQYFVKV